MTRSSLTASLWLGVAWLSVATAIAGFLLPWARLDATSVDVTGQVNQALGGTPLEALVGTLTKKLGNVVIEVKHGAETVTGRLPDLSQIPTQVTGAQIPQLINRQDAQVVLALAEMLTGERELGAKSYVVYLVPGLVLAGAILLTVLGRLRLMSLVIGIASVVVAGMGFWKLLTVKTDTLLVAVTFGPGLWLSLWAYVGLGISAMGRSISATRRRTA